jgi:DNA-binding transcriptional LysR family regulator
MAGYDPQLLVTFLAVEQTGSFTRAAARLGIQQPTVSQHIRRLEEQVGRTLVLRDTHSVSLTADGEAMTGFARNIIAASEQAAAYFSGSRPRGRLRIGIADDLALTRLPQILRDFRRENPLVDFDLTVDQSGLLHQRLDSGRLDVFIGKRPSGEQRGQLVKRDRLVWVGTPSTRIDLTKPLPLVVYAAPSISRTEIRRAGEPGRAAVSQRVRLPRRQRAHRGGGRGHRHFGARGQPGPGPAQRPGPRAPAARTRHDRPGLADQPANGPASRGAGPDLDRADQRVTVADGLPRRDRPAGYQRP